LENLQDETTKKKRKNESLDVFYERRRNEL
jgi:hypothetical protein